MSFTPKSPASAPDFHIKSKDSATGKYRIVGAGWKKSGQFGPFISLSIGPKGEAVSYLMVDARPEGKPPAPSSERDLPDMPKAFSEDQWKSLEKSAQSGPTDPKEDMPDDDLGI